MPGKYAVRLTDGTYVSTQPLTVIEDPRNTAAGVTTADLREQFDHNMRVRDLVSEINQLVARVRAAQQSLKGKPDSALATGCDRQRGGAPDHALDSLQQAGIADAHHVSVPDDEFRG